MVQRQHTQPMTLPKQEMDVYQDVQGNQQPTHLLLSRDSQIQVSSVNVCQEILMVL